MKSKLYIVSLMLLALFIGCESDDDKGPTGPGEYTPTDSTWSDGSGGWFVRLDATSYERYRYYNLDAREVVDISDQQAGADDDWHIAFSRINGKLNGGASGPIGIVGVDLADIGHSDSINFDAVSSLPAIQAEQWEEDVVNLVFDGWYLYTGPPEHKVLPTHNLFVMVTAVGNYAKVKVDTIKNPAREDPGTLTLKYVYQPDGSTDLSGQTQEVDLDASSGLAYWSFARGGSVEVLDPTTSLEWDLMFDGYEARINGGISGPGQASVYPMYLEINDFDAVVSAPQGGGYFADAIQSIFGAPTVPGSEWYDYNPVVHEIISKGHIYILKLPGDQYFKLAIVNYYYVIEGQPQSGWVTLRFKEL